MDIRPMTEMHPILNSGFDFQRILRYDDRLKRLAERIFNSFDPSKVEVVGATGIFKIMISAWTAISQRSNVTRSLSTIISGSVAEGGSLCRLFQPGGQHDLELEIDLMHVVGCIDEKAARICLEAIPSAEAFIKLRDSPEIEHYLDSRNYPKLAHPGCTYLNASAYKSYFSDLQPVDASRTERADASDRSSLLGPRSIDSRIDGPSAAITLRSERTAGYTQRQYFLDILTASLRALGEMDIQLNSRLSWFSERHDTFSAVNSYVSGVTERLGFTAFHSSNISDGDGEIISQELQKFQALANAIADTGKLLKDALDYIKTLTTMFKVSDRVIAKLNVTLDDLGLQINSQRTTWTLLVSPLRTGGDDFPLLDKCQELLRLIRVFDDSTIAMLKRDIDSVLTLIRITIDDLTPVVAVASNHSKQDSNPASSDVSIAVSVDNVPCFYCPFWPSVANEWLVRRRAWPSPEQISRISKNGCHVVPKERPANGTENDWRWSFSIAERALASFRTPSQRCCWFSFKSMFYKYLKFKVEGVGLSSYVAKSCMLHLCEMHPASWWDSERNDFRVECLIALLSFMKQSLTDRLLPHYFMKHVNVLAGVPEPVTVTAAELIGNLLELPLGFLPLDESCLRKLDMMMSQAEKIEVDDPNQGSHGINGHSDSSYRTTTDQRKLEHMLSLRTTALTSLTLYIRSQCLFQYYNLKVLGDGLKALTRVLPPEAIAQLDVTVQAIEEKKSAAQAEARVTLRNVAKLTYPGCLKCDICHRLIACGDVRYDCDHGCSFNVCRGCYEQLSKEQILPKALEDIYFADRSLHPHSLIISCECSPFCYSQFTEERLGRQITSDVVRFYAKQLSTESCQVMKTVSTIGGSRLDYIHRNIDDPGAVMSELSVFRLKKQETLDDASDECTDIVRSVEVLMNDINRLKLVLRTIYGVTK